MSHCSLQVKFDAIALGMEAEDMVQEAYLRYHQVDQAAIQSPKAFLSTIITRLCLDQLKSAKTQRENYVGTWLPEPLLTGPSPSAVVGERETISLAFMVLLENLSPIERAVFLLREVFDYSYAEIAPIVGKSEANCRRYYHKAKDYLKERRPRFEPNSEEQSKLLSQFMQVMVNGDVQGLTNLLAEDVVMYGDGGGKAPAARHPQVGREMVMRLLFGFMKQIPLDLTVEVAEVNGEVSLLFYQAGMLMLVMNFTMIAGKIITIRNVLNPDKLAYLQTHRP